MKTIIIIQARMTSTRLPGKVLKPVLDKPLLAYQVDRLRRVKLAEEIIIATTINAADQPIVDFCLAQKVLCFRGSEDDVLARYYGAATSHQGDLIVRVTSDCPVIDPEVIDKVIHFYIENQGKLDYAANILERSYPRGMDTEVFSYQVLKEAYLEAKEKPDREHVTPFIYRQPERYHLGNIAYLSDQSYHRWTVDTPEDLELIRRIIEALYPLKPQFILEDILNLLKENPDWLLINQHIEQKKLGH